MKHFRLIFGLALIPIGAFLGYFVPIGNGGSGIIIGFVVGCVLSYLFLIYGPGYKNHLLTAYNENRAQLNRLNQQPYVKQLPYGGDRLSAPCNLREKEASGAQEEYENDEHIDLDTEENRS
jgi:hypothetical protein